MNTIRSFCKPARLCQFLKFQRSTNFIRISLLNSKHNSNGQNDYQNFQESNYNPTILILTVASAYFIHSFKDKSNLQTVKAIQKQNVQVGQFEKGLATYSAEEVSKHDCKINGIWVSFGEGVYDITEFVDKHPGGPGKIMMAAGGSIEPFWTIFANHNQNDVYELLESMRIGNLAHQDMLPKTKDQNDPYANEPMRHKTLKVNGHKPFCAEPPPPMLIESYITPTELFYVRNHLPVPEVDMKDYSLDLAVEDQVVQSLKYEELKKMPKSTITSAIMCGGNRRSEMAEVKHVRGLSWSVAAIGNATWTGVKLCDILKNLGVNESEYSHVQFEGLDMDPSGMPYSTSIPISKALDPRADVLLAFEMNGQTISRDHGFPIRVIVPGVVGARNVKWLAKIKVSKKESPSQWQQGDYKGFAPSVDWDNVDFKTSPAIQEMPVTSAICTPQANETVVAKNGIVPVKGYAWSGGGRKIIRVDVTADQGQTWHVAQIFASDERAGEGKHWGWTLWQIDLPVESKNKEIEIWSKAVDSSYNVQPESFQNIWNLRGLLCNAYHRVKITVTS